MNKYGKKPTDTTIVDATACTGGDTITFCEYFSRGIPIELSQEKFNMLIHNLAIYGFNNAYPINNDCIEIMKDIETDIHVIFLDVPWGGNSYKYQEKLELMLGDMPLDKVVKLFFEIRNELKLIVLKLPNNYDFVSLKEKLCMYTIEIYSFKKMKMVFLERM
jgi:16S rRNA G966 N2-methylase RsmD